jgi:hypothetical protein
VLAEPARCTSVRTARVCCACCELRRKDPPLAPIMSRREGRGLFRSAAVSRKRRRKRRSRIPNYRFTSGSCGPRAPGYWAVGLCFLAYAFRRGVKRRMREDHFFPGDKVLRLTGWIARKSGVRRLSLVQASAPRPVRDSSNRISATLEKPLRREFLFHPWCNLSRCCPAVASVLRGSLAYRGSLCCLRTAGAISAVA